MGGRVYDAEIGRFLSADPFVQDSGNLQALNRYSYVLNNPLSYTDPTGYFVSKLKKALKRLWKRIRKAHKRVVNAFVNFHKKVLRKLSENQFIATAVSIGVGIACGAAASQCVMLLNAAMTAANGGTLKQVLTGAAVGYIGGRLSAGLGQVIGGIGASAGRAFVSNTGAAMLVGGAVAKAQGGKFIDGVKGAAVGAAIGYAIKGILKAVSEPASAKSAQDHSNPRFKTDENGERYFLDSDGNRAYPDRFLGDNGNQLIADNRDYSSELSVFPDAEASGISGALDSIEPWGPGAKGVPGGKTGFKFSQFILNKVFKGVGQSPHQQLNQSRRGLSDFYYNSSPGVRGEACMRCHSSP